MGCTYKKRIKTLSKTLIALATWVETQCIESQSLLFLLNTRHSLDKTKRKTV